MGIVRIHIGIFIVQPSKGMVIAEDKSAKQENVYEINFLLFCHSILYLYLFTVHGLT